VDIIVFFLNFFEGGVIVIRCSSILNGLFIFLLKANLDSSFVINELVIMAQSREEHKYFQNDLVKKKRQKMRDAIYVPQQE